MSLLMFMTLGSYLEFYLVIDYDAEKSKPNTPYPIWFWSVFFFPAPENQTNGMKRNGFLGD